MPVAAGTFDREVGANQVGGGGALGPPPVEAAADNNPPPFISTHTERRECGPLDMLQSQEKPDTSYHGAR